MDKHTTPEPHHLPGYMGHCSNYQYYIGGTYGRLTNRALLNPSIPHSKDVNLTVIHRPGETVVPSARERSALYHRQHFVDAVYRDPIIPGYRGFVPKIRNQIGKRFLAAATAALAEHEGLMEERRCELRNLRHGDILQNSIGVFESHLGERLIPKTKYRAPLMPVNQKIQGVPVPQDCRIAEQKVPYSKDQVPHFKENHDADKWIINGYCGHIPRIRFLYGQSNKPSTRAALNEFSDNIRRTQYHEICNVDEMEPAAAECMAEDCDIYHKDSNIIPHYGGHVPGRIFKFGKRFAVESTGVKDWLEMERIAAAQIPPPRCGEQCRRV